MSQIIWYGHSAFKIQSGDSCVVIDPFFAPGSGCAWQQACPADLVLVTHDHGDHVGDAVSICKKSGAALGCAVGTADALVKRGLPVEQVLNGIGFGIGGTLVHKNISVTMTQAFHSSDTGVPVGYIVKMPDGLVVYHAGDTGIFSSMAILGQIHKIDVALLPIGGVFTMDAAQAAQACKLLNCGRVIPMHWGTFPVLAQSPAEFQRKLAEVFPSCQCINMTRRHAVEIAPEKEQASRCISE